MREYQRTPARGLVRFFEDLIAPTVKARIVPVAFACERCGRFYNVAVRFVDDDPTVLRLPDNCATCGEMLDTPDHLRDLIGTARMLIETVRARRLS